MQKPLRNYRDVACPLCGAGAGQTCNPAYGNLASGVHLARVQEHKQMIHIDGIEWEVVRGLMQGFVPTEEDKNIFLGYVQLMGCKIYLKDKDITYFARSNNTIEGLITIQPDKWWRIELSLSLACHLKLGEYGYMRNKHRNR